MTSGQQTERTGAAPAPAGRLAGRALLAPLAWALAGALLVALLGQLPASHPVDLGGLDAAYAQGFYEPEPSRAPGAAPPAYLAGSDGTARWSRGSAALLFPQAGLPGEITLRLRGWRESGPPPELSLWLNGAEELARIQASGDWQELTLPVRGGLLKPSDLFVEIRSATVALADGREVGVLVDRALYRTAGWPILPYPAQLVYGALAGGLLWALLGRGPQGGRGTARGEHGQGRTQGAKAVGRRWPGLTSPLALALLGYGLIWTLLYRIQPPLYPFPIRWLPPALVVGLAALLALREGPALLARWPLLLRAAAPAGVVGLWLALTLATAQSHVTLARPGVENDFRVFATRETLGQIFSADGFYNLGYPLLLWLARPLFDGNAFLAGRLVAALAGVVALGAGYWLARTLLPPGPALAALLLLALSGAFAQYGLLLGSDMPFAACTALCVAATIAAQARGRAAGRGALALAAAAGLFGGLAFLMRHPGLLLLLWGLLALWLGGRGRPGAGPALAWFAAGFLLAAAPQLIVNTLQTGQPLFNQQAKNIWLAVYAGTDWGRWEEAPNSVGLAEVVLADPPRFLANWWANIVAYTGSGAEDQSEFGRAIQLRLLGWPANWLAVAGLLGWGWVALRRVWQGRSTLRPYRGVGGGSGDGGVGRSNLLLAVACLLLLIVLYVAAVSTAFALPRFFLPLAPIYAVAAGWSLWMATGGGRALAATALVLVVVLWGGFAAGGRAVIAAQPADEVAAVQMVEAVAPGGAPIAARVSARLPLAKYSAIAHRVVDWPAGSDTGRPVGAEEIAALRDAGARYLLWDEAAGPPPLPDPQAARAGASPRYGLYDLGP